MFHSKLKPVGLYVERGRELVHVNIKSGNGNFHMKPNGIFYISGGNAAVAETQAFLKRRPQVGTAGSHLMTLKWLIAPVVVYGAFVALVYVDSAYSNIFRSPGERPRLRSGSLTRTRWVLDTADGERVIVWHVPPRSGQPVFVYLHGNGGSLRWREERFRDLIDDGSGLVALSYRGYGGSSGRPTERGLIEDARAAYAFAVAHYPAGRLVLWGESPALRSRLRWQPTTLSGVLCWRLHLPQPSMSARSTTGLCRCGS